MLGTVCRLPDRGRLRCPGDVRPAVAGPGQESGLGQGLELRFLKHRQQQEELPGLRHPAAPLGPEWRSRVGRGLERLELSPGSIPARQGRSLNPSGSWFPLEQTRHPPHAPSAFSWEPDRSPCSLGGRTALLALWAGTGLWPARSAYSLPLAFLTGSATGTGLIAANETQFWDFDGHSWENRLPRGQR